MQIQKFPAPLSAEQITRSLEAYLMWLFGKVMFTENHVSTISALYIPMALEIASAEMVDQIRQRSWGSTVLAATYRGMCNGCQLSSTKPALLGCPLFLQLWSWERFSIGRRCSAPAAAAAAMSLHALTAAMSTSSTSSDVEATPS
jgi:hypothetical protein